MPAGPVVARLESLGLSVVSYRVCSGSVDVGQVRQIIASTDETVLVDLDGVTEAGLTLEQYSIVEVKISTGVPGG